jgi:curli production assembly/transport component CsgE
MKNKRIKVLLALLFFITSLQLFSQESDTTINKELPKDLKSILKKYQKAMESENNINEENLTVELDGLIIDETISKIGRDFYTYFYDNWNISGNIKDYTLYITEKPMPGMGNMIIVKINYDEIFRNRISPRQEVIESLANYAIAQSKQYLMNYQAIKEQLEGDDMSGTGIY